MTCVLYIKYTKKRQQEKAISNRSEHRINKLAVNQTI